MNILGPMDVQQVIDRIRDQVTELRAVGGAADYAAAYERPGALPSAFVILVGEQVVSQPMSGGVSLHTVTATVDVALAVRNYKAAERGQAQLDAAVPMSNAVRVALNNWSPTIGAEIVEPMRGNGNSRVLRYDANILWWADRFTVVYRDRATN